MIASLNGRTQEVLPDSIIIDVGGVGSASIRANSSREQLHAGELVFLYTYLVVRPDIIASIWL